nr:LysE family translocator [Tumebacillus amylolyticus]
MSIVLVITPGVDTALTTKTTLASGRKSGTFLVFGLCTGVVVHTIAATVGLSAILMKSAMAFLIVKYIGALYLVYLGSTAIWATRRSKQQAHRQGLAEVAVGADSTAALPLANSIGRASVWTTYRQGLFSNVLNPKMAVFFLTFLPQFVVPEIGTAKQLFFMGASYAVLSIVWYLAYVYFINYLRKWLQSPTVQNWLERVTGAVLIVFGFKLALEKQ